MFTHPKKRSFEGLGGHLRKEGSTIEDDRKLYAYHFFPLQIVLYICHGSLERIINFRTEEQITFSMYQATTLAGKEISIEIKDNEITYDGSPLQWSLAKNGANTFLINKNNKPFRAEILSIDYDTKEVSLKIDKSIYNISLKDKMDLLLKEMGIDNLASAKVNDVKAPMPGLILELLVKVGDVVDKGDKLLILEAMKMENVLKSPGEGTISSIEVTQGDSVEKNQVLIKF